MLGIQGKTFIGRFRFNSISIFIKYLNILVETEDDRGKGESQLILTNKIKSID